MRLTIDGKLIEASDGSTILTAAEAAGIAIPTLCHYRATGALTSCMVCVVKDEATGKMLPACAARAEDGMRIDAAGDEVRAARREIIRMLLREHVGDCEAPCARICPANLNVPRMLRYLAAGDRDSAARLARHDLIFPATLGRICPAPCTKGCRRAVYDAAIDIPGMHRDLGASLSCEAPATGKTVAVIGAGLAGLAAAAISLRQGHACRVYEKRDVACAGLRNHPELAEDILDCEIGQITQAGADIRYNCEMIDTRIDCDAIVVACEGVDVSGDNVFVAKEEKLAARSVANGKWAAYDADAFLKGLPHPPHKRFNSQIGRLTSHESAAYAHARHSCESRNPSSIPHGDSCFRRNDGRDLNDEGGSMDEAARCLHCDCHKPLSCKLRQYAEEYGVAHHDAHPFARPPVQPILRDGNIVYDRGKCILCGICVELTRAAGNAAGLAFSARGAQSCVAPALGASLHDALGEAAAECVRACPTAALAFADEEETS